MFKAVTSLTLGILAYLNPFNFPSLQGELFLTETPGTKTQTFVYLPPNYTSDEEYPVLVHLHGARAFLNFVKNDIAATAHASEQYGEQGMIIVAPFDRTGFAYWADGDSIAMASTVLDDVLPYIEEEYSVDSNRRFLSGFSMGGQGASVWPFKFRDKQFSKVVLLDGAYHTFGTLVSTQFRTARDQFGNEEARYDPWSPFTVTNETSWETLKGVDFLMYLGTVPDMLLRAERFRAHLVEIGANAQFVSTKLPHSAISFLEMYGKDVMEFLSRQET